MELSKAKTIIVNLFKFECANPDSNDYEQIKKDLSYVTQNCCNILSMDQKKLKFALMVAARIVNISVDLLV